MFLRNHVLSCGDAYCVTARSKTPGSSAMRSIMDQGNVPQTPFYLCIPQTFFGLSARLHNGLTVSTALSTTAVTRSLRTAPLHSTSNVSSHTFAICLSTL